MKSTTTFIATGLTAFLLTAPLAAFAAPETPVSAATIEAATTPAEHLAIAKLFEEEAANLTRKSEMHAEMAKTYSAPGGKPSHVALAKHCAAVAQDYKAAAKQNLALAAIHHSLADGGAK